MAIGFLGIWIFSLLDRSPNAQQDVPTSPPS
jgi:Na+(H+)/acetate symporter ActP